MSVPGEIKILISWEIQIIYAPREKKNECFLEIRIISPEEIKIMSESWKILTI